MAYNSLSSLQFSDWGTPQNEPTSVDNSTWLNTGCQYRSQYLAKPAGRGVACKNGVPYDCKCNLIQKPYSMPYEARWKAKPGCPSGGQGVWYVRPPYFLKQT